MKRTAEKVLSIISTVFTAIAVVGSFFFLAFVKMITSDGVARTEMEMELHSDAELSPDDVEAILWVVDLLEGFGWFFVIVLIISLIATIVGIVFIWNDKNPKLAGIMFIIGGLFALVLSPTSILLYIAGILCLTKKPPLTEEPMSIDDDFNDAMRPL